jgi:DNA-binding transcriptional LysR family regulator
LELRHISSFLVLAEELNFGRAAARLDISQPWLSQQLQQLEQRIGARLVARTSHAVRLTGAGEAFLQEARPLLGQLDRAVEAARQAGRAESGHLRIGFNFPAGQRILVPTLSLLHEKYPDLRTSLLPAHTRGQLTELQHGRLDIAFIYGAHGEKGTCHRSVLTLPVVGFCASDHPLATGERIRWAELAKYRCLLPSPQTSPGLHNAVTDAARRNGVDFSAAEVFEDGDAAMVMVACQQIVGFTSAVRAESVTAPGLAALWFAEQEPRVTIYAIWRQPDLNPAVPLFLDVLEEARSEYMR